MDTLSKIIFQNKFPTAQTAFLAGSYARNQATKYSDLDLVVIYEKLPNAYRESFMFEGYPVEAFAHDAETLKYFFWEVDRPTGIPSLANMIKEGIEIPSPSELSRKLKLMADEVLDAGPPALSQKETDHKRYFITDLVDDIREPRNKHELCATGTQLYPLLADFFFRAQGLWSAKGKAIPRVLEKTDADFSKKYIAAFDSLFREANPRSVIELAEEILKPYGGFLFDGFRVDAKLH